jgi:endonuclease YncB( thermonuclease family)
LGVRKFIAVVASLLVLLPLPAAGEDAYFVLCGYHAPHDTCVYDGDTFWLRGRAYRIEDFDAPEKRGPKCVSEAILASDATRRLIEILNGSPFVLVQRGGRDIDRYGRRLRTVEIAGQSIATILIAEGLARAWTGKRQPWCA